MIWIEPGGDPLPWRIAKAAFPSENTKKLRLQIAHRPLNCSSYWEGGSRSFFVFVRLDTMQATPQMPQQSAYDPELKGLDRVELREGICCVEHRIFQGKNSGIIIHLHPDNAARLLPPPSAPLPFCEAVVLYATRSLKSSYGGIPNFRQHSANRHTGITSAEYDAGKAALIAKGLLNKAGAITPAGRNAIASVPSGSSWPIRPEEPLPDLQIGQLVFD